MPWLRAHGRGCAALALLAMALQIFCTLGHFHVSNGAGAKASILSSSGADIASVVAEAATPLSGGDGDVVCPLCLVGHLVASAVAVSGPALVLPVASVLLGPLPVAAGRAVIDARAAFWSRGPPLF